MTTSNKLNNPSKMNSASTLIKPRWLNIAIIMLIIVEIMLNGWLIYQDSRIIPFNELPICTTSSCENVQNTEYGTIFGIKLSYYAIVAFLVLPWAYFWNKKGFFYLSLIGGLVALYFISIQAFVLKQFCTICLFIDGIMIVIFALGFWQKKVY